MAEEEALLAIETLGLLKPSKDATANVGRGDDDETDNHNSEEEEDPPTDEVVCGRPVARNASQADSGKQMASLKAEIAELKGLLKESKAKEASARKEFSKREGEREVQIDALKAILAEEKETSKRMRAQVERGQPFIETIFSTYFYLTCCDVYFKQKSQII